MGTVMIGIAVKEGVVEAKFQCEKATSQEMSVAIAQMEILKERLIAEIKKLNVQFGDNT